MSVTYNGTNYYYATNVQGDVTAILNTSGTAVVQYTYDAWGNILSTSGSMADTLGESNPLRYRGYVYDDETNLYYLQSRYYNSAMGRFINADAFTSTGQGLLGNNMFAYCLNDPVSKIDPNGNAPISSRINQNAMEGAIAAIVITVVLSGTNVSNQLAKEANSAKRDVYKFANAVKDIAASTYESHQPRVHHVIPAGDFSAYGPETVAQLNEMHHLIRDVNIDINDPENLIILSQGSHKSLHTRGYISAIYSIMMWADGGSELDVRIALFFARTYAASLDQYSYGY